MIERHNNCLVLEVCFVAHVIGPGAPLAAGRAAAPQTAAGRLSGALLAAGKAAAEAAAGRNATVTAINDFFGGLTNCSGAGYCELNVLRARFLHHERMADI